MQENIESLKQRNQEWIDIVNSRDIEAYAGLLTEDAVWFPPGSNPIVGREAFKKWLAPFFDQFEYDFDISDIRINVSKDRAVQKASFTSNMTPENGGKQIQHRGTFLVLWNRGADDVWRIERYIDDTDL